MINSDGSIHITSDVTGRNPFTGRFVKGMTPNNKGKKWSEWMPKKSQKMAAKGWKNLDKYRNKNGRSDVAGRCRKKVVAVKNNGTYIMFAYLGDAAEWIGGNRENVGRCCRCNASRKVCQHDWRPGFGKGADRVNTDHQYKGVRFYFADDPIWMDKINKPIIP